MTYSRPLLLGGTMISEVDFNGVTHDDLTAWFAYDELMTAEAPLTPVQLSRVSLRNLPDHVTARLFVARDPDGAVAADGRAIVTRAANNSQTCHIHVSVRPDRRGRGIAKALLRLIVGVAESEERTSLIGWSTDRVDAGAQFAERLGAEPVEELLINKLLLSELDPDILGQWVTEASTSARDYSLIAIEGAYPGNMLAGIVQLRVLVMNSEPNEALLPEMPITTVEEMRAVEGWLSGLLRWSLIAMHRPTGEIAGFTEVYYRRAYPDTVHQGATIVHPEHRGKGLGKWLKAVMLERIAAELPHSKEIRTGNSVSNAAMLCINRALGFKPWMAATAWQVSVARGGAMYSTTNRRWGT